jgi:hypothetical protein
VVFRTTPNSFVQPKRLSHERVAKQKARALILAPFLHSTQPERNENDATISQPMIHDQKEIGA